ncbi:ADP-ribosylglycohydrolase family protein [Periweissella cryptocerci]|nr:ADP-ribosylglycohydrolase family protein [Periweissella cryptocerci]
MPNNDQLTRAIYGVALGDAFGLPFQVLNREELATVEIVLSGYGTYNQPAGTWSADTSMTLATLDALSFPETSLDDIMDSFLDWNENDAYTPFMQAYDQGAGTLTALRRYKRSQNALTAGGTTEWDNGNGALMRIVPAIFYTYHRYGHNLMDNPGALIFLHQVAGLTHNHVRGHIAIGIYAAIMYQLLNGVERHTAIRAGIHQAYVRYMSMPSYRTELKAYERLIDAHFGALPVDAIKSSGYVVDTLEAVIWLFENYDDFEQSIVAAVRLGDDTDSIGALIGALELLASGSFDSVPVEWLHELQAKDMIEDYLQKARDSDNFG